MGGLGSGGSNSKGKYTTNSRLQIKVKSLKEGGVFRIGYAATMYWGKLFQADIVTCQNGLIHISWISPHDGKPYDQFLGYQLDRHPRHFGGHQAYFVCQTCCRRCTRIYFCPDRFACRLCQRLTYRSQLTRFYWRLRDRLEKLEKKLSWEFHWGCKQIPPRPKGMHSFKYEKIKNEYLEGKKLMYKLYYKECGRIIEVHDRKRLRGAI